ncbi:MAG: hypothetical protein CL949_15630, partial [Erythrobacter sp.]|nr:hypothetical protein [Erythrobacter sp.]
MPSQGDGQDVVLRLDQVQAQAPRVLDLGFLIDVTGSMEDELRFVNREVADIVARVSAESPETQVRVGAVFYRDRTDHPALQRIAFTHDVHGFAQAMQSVHASGGGDGAMASSDDIPPSLEADFVVLRKMRDDDASGDVLKEFFG